MRCNRIEIGSLCCPLFQQAHNKHLLDDPSYPLNQQLNSMRI
ncbi:hypothetical protein V7200_21290 [Cytobacillus firmus]|uniref:Uncharacterized protein n=1 Tax=Cytobacillus firmus TaxID=1399 RepID=A0A800N9G2_CYTFI|nr:hypothetical protein [Cytobacillus firmus]KAF0822534.1 hypothetical protein KIS1582_3681 [Cytobacillus firmus]